MISFARWLTLDVTLLLASITPAFASAILSEKQALERAFPEAALERTILYLTEAQVTRVEEAARSRLPSPVVTLIVARVDDEIVGRAYLDTHVVRTMPETVLTAVGPDGRLKAVYVLQFAEPPDYLPRERWLEAFGGRSLDDELFPGRGIPRVTGATLTVKALTDSVRRCLALDRDLRTQEKR